MKLKAEARQEWRRLSTRDGPANVLQHARKALNDSSWPTTAMVCVCVGGGVVRGGVLQHARKALNDTSWPTTAMVCVCVYGRGMVKGGGAAVVASLRCSPLNCVASHAGNPA